MGVWQIQKNAQRLYVGQGSQALLVEVRWMRSSWEPDRNMKKIAADWAGVNDKRS
jgi:hypothetical protein